MHGKHFLETPPPWGGGYPLPTPHPLRPSAARLVASGHIPLRQRFLDPPLVSNIHNSTELIGVIETVSIRFCLATIVTFLHQSWAQFCYQLRRVGPKLGFVFLISL